MKKAKYYVFMLFLMAAGICFINLDAVKELLYDRLNMSYLVAEETTDKPVPDDTRGTDETMQSDSSLGEADDPAAAVPDSGAETTGGTAAVGETTPDGGAGPVKWQYAEAPDSYFDDALFIGDSRTVGMYEYGGLENSTFYASTGLTIYKMFSAEIVPVPGSKKKITVEEALGQRQFGKIYLMIGINEMGTGTVDSFIEKYQEQVERLRQLQPDAVIYLQGILRVSTERSQKGDYITNEGIDARNEEIAKMADGEHIFYLDVNPLVCDETGGLVKSYTFDGVHLKAEYVLQWRQFLQQHTIEFIK